MLADLVSSPPVTTDLTRWSPCVSLGIVAPARPYTVTPQPWSARYGANLRTAVSNPP